MDFKNLLQMESEFYQKNRKSLLLKYPNRHLLIHEDQLIGDFSTHEAAVKVGVRHFGRGPFLVRLSGENEAVLDAPALRLGLLRCQ